MVITWIPTEDYMAVLNSKHVIIYKKVYCSPCIYMHIKPPCKGNNICMQEIGVDEVFSESINPDVVSGQFSFTKSAINLLSYSAGQILHF